MIDLIYHLFDSCVHHVYYRHFYLIIQELAHEMHYLIPLGSPTGKNKCKDCGYQMHFSLFHIFKSNDFINSTLNDLLFKILNNIKRYYKEKNQQNPTA